MSVEKQQLKKSILRPTTASTLTFKSRNQNQNQNDTLESSQSQYFKHKQRKLEKNRDLLQSATSNFSEANKSNMNLNIKSQLQLQINEGSSSLSQIQLQRPQTSNNKKSFYLKRNLFSQSQSARAQNGQSYKLFKGNSNYEKQNNQIEDQGTVEINSQEFQNLKILNTQEDQVETKKDFSEQRKSKQVSKNDILIGNFIQQEINNTSIMNSNPNLQISQQKNKFQTKIGKSYSQTSIITNNKQLQIQEQSSTKYNRRGAIGIEQIDKLKELETTGDKKGRLYGFILMTHYEKQKNKMEDLKYLPRKIYDEQKEQLKQTTQVVQKILENVIAIYEDIKNEAKMEINLNQILEQVKQQKNLILTQFIILQFAKFMQEIRKLRISLNLFKNLKRQSQKNENYVMKMKAYYGLSKTLLMLKKYDESKYLSCKLLQMSWFCKKPKHELKSYYLLALYYYYTGDVNKSQFYEQRASLHHYESETKGVKKLCVNFLQHKLKRLRETKIQYTSLNQFNSQNKNFDNNQNPSQEDKLGQEESMHLNSSDDEYDRNVIKIIPEPPEGTEQDFLARTEDYLGLKYKNLFAENITEQRNEIPLRDQLPFNPHHDYKFILSNKFKYDQAIRQIKYPDSMTWLKTRPEVKMDINKVKNQMGPMKKKIFLNQMSNIRQLDLRFFQRKFSKNNEAKFQLMLFQGQTREHWAKPDYHKASSLINKILQALRCFLSIKDGMIEKYFQNYDM